jgi:tRNA U34 2-thiouridine synthase MnmA/TrmU
MAKKAAKAPKKAKARKTEGVRQGTKTEKVLDLLKRSGGASLKDIMTATDWEAHSVRGFLSGTIGKQMGLKVESTKTKDGERIYSLRN